MTLRALVLASHYRADHERAMRPYRRLNPAASSWNTALFAELGKLDIELHIVQFWPVTRYRRFVEGRVTHHYLPKLPWLDNFTSIFKRWRVRRLVHKLSPDVVHGIGSEHGYAWAAIGHGVPSIITIHGWLRVINTLAGHASLLKRWFLVREEAQALRQADRVIAINEYMRDRFVNEGGCALERTVVIPNALNPVYLQDWSESPRPIDIIMVGTLQPLKNQHVALELFHRLARDHGMHPRVVIVGAATVDSTDYRDRLHAMREEMGLTNVEFVGKKSPAPRLQTQDTSVSDYQLLRIHRRSSDRHPRSLRSFNILSRIRWEFRNSRSANPIFSSPVFKSRIAASKSISGW